MESEHKAHAARETEGGEDTLATMNGGANANDKAAKDKAAIDHHEMP